MAIHQPIDPAAILQAAFPHNLLDSKARECRFVLRRRDFNPVTFSWALITRILAHSCTSIASVWREYERLTGTSIDRSSFYKHFDFAEFKGPYELGSWAVEKEASMLCHVYGVLLAWAASRRLRLEVIGLTSEINVPDEHLVAPLGRWRVRCSTTCDIARSVVLKRRSEPHIVPLLCTAARDPNRSRIPLVARNRRIPRNACVTPIVS